MIPFKNRLFFQVIDWKIAKKEICKKEDIIIILDAIGKKIGALRNSETDYDRVYKRVIKDLQDGYLGKVTFDKIKV